MTRGDSSPRELSREQHRSREEILTQRRSSLASLAASTLVLKRDELFLLCDESGDVYVERDRGLGLFWQDTRFLSRYELTLNDRHPLALSSEHGAGEWTSHCLENEAIPAAGGAKSIPGHTLAIRRFRSVPGGTVRELIAVTNYGDSPQQVRLKLGFGADFADIFIVRKFTDRVPGRALPAQLEKSRVCLRFAGSDGAERATRLTFWPAPSALDDSCATFELQIDHRECREITVEITPVLDGQSAQPQGGESNQDPREATSPAAPSGEALLDSAARVNGNPLLESVIRRSLLDLALLSSRLGGQQDLRYIAGGVPWFVTLFGRDSAIASIEVAAFWPVIAGETARLLAKFQATRTDDYRDAQPGKILHELRRGELARLGAVPQSPVYYGSVDSTLLFLILLGEYVDWSGDVAAVRQLRKHIDAALEWIERYGDSDGDGYLDYRGQYSRGLVNQGWKDSGNAIVNADGSLATPPIALCEVQGYLFRAWQSTAKLLRAIDETARAEELRAKADRLRERFERDFWSDDLDCYVLALQQGGRPAAVVSSNAGQVLWSGISSGDHAARVARRLMAHDMFSGWGIRTLASAEKRFNPLSYHLGSVWPHDNALILSGLKRYGHHREATRVFDALFDAAHGFRDHRMPELYCGFERRAEERHPVHYPVACSPQAWAAGSLLYGLTSLLGLRADAANRRLQIIRPCLPRGIDRLELERLQVGGARVDLAFARNRGTVEVSSNVVSGELKIECAGEARPGAVAHDERKGN